MAIIYTYPQINSSSDLAASDLMIISDMSANGRPTKSLTLKNLADFITTTGTGTGTTNAIIKWTDGPAGLLGDSIMNEDVDKINLNGILTIAESNNRRLEIKYGSDSDTGHINNAPQNNQIIGRAGDLIIKNRARTKDILFQADDGQYDGSVTTYFRLDGSMADISNPDLYTRWGDNSRIVLGNTTNANNLDFEMYHDGSTTYMKNGSFNLNIESKGGIYIENKSGGSGDIDIIQSVTNADVNISAYNGSYFKADTSAGATIFSKPVEVPLVPAANANAASKQYVDQQIASIPAGLVFQGNWDANANSPTLASGVGTVGNYYVVSTPGNTNLDGITDWEVGDWAVFVEVGGVDKWDKIDQTFVQGAGAVGQVSFWNGINSVTGDNGLYWDNSNKRLGIGTTSPAEKLHVEGNIQLGTFNKISGGSSDNLVIAADFNNASGNSSIDFQLDGATSAMFINNSRNVGIGTTSPVTKLHIDEPGTAAAALFIDTARYGASIVGDGTSNSQYLLNLQSNGGSTEVMRVQSSGNVGIGTTSPAEKLEVAGNIGINQYILHNNDLNTFFGFPGNDTVSVGTNGVERMRVNSSGNVGIGTTSPAAALDVVGRIGLNDGNNNVSVGDNAGDALTTGARNVAIGYNALTNEDTTGRNVAVGYHALATQNAGSDAFNVAVGYFAGAAITTGIYNVLLGGNAGSSIDTGNDNIIIGLNAGDALTSGSQNIAIGQSALSSEDTHGKNVAIGHAALIVQNAGVDAYNIALGFHAGKEVTTGIQNSLIGGLAGDSLNTGSFNIALGFAALTSEDTGNKNIAIGRNALYNLNFNGDGYNVAVGHQSGENITTGDQNTIIGGLAGDALTTGTNNVIIGYNAAASAAGVADEITLGNANNDTIRAAVTSITSLSDERDKKDIEELPYGLDFVDSLKPKKFTWNHRPQIKIEVDDEGNETEVEIYSSRKGSKDIGFIAQELDAIDDEYTNLVYKSNPEKLEATYGRLIPILVKAIQELSAEVKMLKNK